MTERRDLQNSDNRRLFDEIGKIHSKISDLNTSFMVYAAKNDGRIDAIEKVSTDHQGKWKQVETAKNRSILVMGVALLSSGAIGAWGKDVAQAAKKLFLE